jgi:MYXO-CTERM domain-containing protein
MRALVAALALLLSLLVARRAAATTCIQPTPEQGAKFADVVFEATAEGDVAPQKSKLRVAKVYLGTVPAEVIALHGGMKGFPKFEKGKRYLVWGIIQDDGLWVHLCSPTHVLPPPKMYTSGLWQDWTPEKQFGAARRPGAALTAGPPATMPSAKPAPPPPAEVASTETPLPPSSSGVEVMPPTEPESPSPEARGGGCAGCASGDGDDTRWPALALLLAALAVVRHRELKA